MEEPLAELANYFETITRLPDEELVRLTAAARAAGSLWEDIVAACGIAAPKDLGGVIDWNTGETGAELLFSATLWGSRTQPLALTWASMRPARTR